MSTTHEQLDELEAMLERARKWETTLQSEIAAAQAKLFALAPELILAARRQLILDSNFTSRELKKRTEERDAAVGLIQGSEWKQPGSSYTGDYCQWCGRGADQRVHAHDCPAAKICGWKREAAKEETKRCLRCKWPLKEKLEDGCIEGNCSYRCDCGSVHREDCPVYVPPHLGP